MQNCLADWAVFWRMPQPPNWLAERVEFEPSGDFFLNGQ
jgi:hypothetical protein